MKRLLPICLECISPNGPPFVGFNWKNIHRTVIHWKTKDNENVTLIEHYLRLLVKSICREEDVSEALKLLNSVNVFSTILLSIWQVAFLKYIRSGITDWEILLPNYFRHDYYEWYANVGLSIVMNYGEDKSKDFLFPKFMRNDLGAKLFTTFCGNIEKFPTIANMILPDYITNDYIGVVNIKTLLMMNYHDHLIHILSMERPSYLMNLFYREHLNLPLEIIDYYIRNYCPKTESLAMSHVRLTKNQNIPESYEPNTEQINEDGANLAMYIVQYCQEEPLSKYIGNISHRDDFKNNIEQYWNNFIPNTPCPNHLRLNRLIKVQFGCKHWSKYEKLIDGKLYCHQCSSTNVIHSRLVGNRVAVQCSSVYGSSNCPICMDEYDGEMMIGVFNKCGHFMHHICGKELDRCPYHCN